VLQEVVDSDYRFGSVAVGESRQPSYPGCESRVDRWGAWFAGGERKTTKEQAVQTNAVLGWLKGRERWLLRFRLTNHMVGGVVGALGFDGWLFP
jgi:hypothetical protein